MGNVTVQDQIKKKIEAEASKYIGDVDRIIRRSLEAATLSLMGIENRGGHAEIDHCNGRNSVLIDAFRAQAITEARKIAKGVKLDAEQRGRFKTAFEKEYSRQVGHAIRSAAQERAKEDAKALVDSITTDVEQFIKD